MFSRFSEEAQKVLIMAKKEMMEMKHPYVGSEHLFLSILSENERIAHRFQELGVTYTSFREELIKAVGLGSEENHWFLYTPLLKRVLENAALTAREMNSNVVSVSHLFLSLLEEGDGIAIRILENMDVDIDNLYDEFSEQTIEKKGKTKKKLLIEEFGVDLTKRALKGDIDPVIGRKEEIQHVIEILSRRGKNNPLLVGDAGVGKTAIVEELARLIAKEEVPDSLRGKRIISVEIASLVAGTKYRGEFEERISKILKEVESRDDVIVFIDEVHTIVGAGGAEGAIDASNILKPSLARGKLRLIGATTMEEYKKTIEKDKAFDRRFQKVEVLEPSDEATYQILSGLKDLYTSFHGVKIEDSLLWDIIHFTNDYMHDRKQPDKSIDILDEVCSMVQLKKEDGRQKILELKRNIEIIREKKNRSIMKHHFKEASVLKEEECRYLSQLNELELRNMTGGKVRNVTKEDIKKVVFQKTKIPIYEMDKTAMKELAKMEDVLQKKIIGQEEAVHALCEFTKRLKFGLKKGKRPASFLFVGPTGVGKTYLAKEYAHYMGGKNSFIRLDMSEFMESHSISKIIGSPSGYVGYDDGKNILEQVRLHPYSVILLDEIEKASTNVINLFLQALDEGVMKDSTGREVSFSHATIIMTSNIGFGKSSLGFCHDTSSVDSKLKEFLSVEFMNRIDKVLVFPDLTRESLEKIVRQKLSEVKRHFQDRGIQLSIGKSVIPEVIALSKFEEFGARKVDKIIEDKIDRLVIDSILVGKKKVSIPTIG